MQERLTPLHTSSECSLYELPTHVDSRVRRVIFSSPETRRICNDTLFTGTDYTRALQAACTKCLSLLREHKLFNASELETYVLHILRGGLNFGLREALTDAFEWKNQNSAFISAQRARSTEDEKEWIITESDYQKLSLHGKCSLLFGDVVATGTSLNFALHEVARVAQEQAAPIEELTFFTIGGPRSHALVESLEKEKLQAIPEFSHATVVYLEGIFDVASGDSPLRIKIDGTDLLRSPSVLAPEFIESQYESPTYPLERCTIYDAGSRAFDIQEYGEDLLEYWQETLSLAQAGTTFDELLLERMPELDGKRFSDVNLATLCESQIEKIHRLLFRG